MSQGSSRTHSYPLASPAEGGYIALMPKLQRKQAFIRQCARRLWIQLSITAFILCLSLPPQDGAGFGSYSTQLGGASDNYLYGNTVTGTIELENSSTGLFAGGAEGNTLCCNIFNNTRYGLFFWGMCNNTRLRHSSIGVHATGLRCQPGTVIGDQVHAGNQWGGSYSEYPGVHWGTFDEISGSEFLVQPPIGTIIWPTGLHSPNNPDWFNPFPGSATNCAGDSGCEPPPSGEKEPPVIDETDIHIAEAGFENPLYGPYLNWEGARHLYCKLANYPSLLGQEGAVDDFFEEAGGTPIAAFYELDAGITALYDSDVLLQARQAALVIYLGQLEKLKAELAEATDENAIAQLNAYIEITGGLLASNWQALQALYQELEAQHLLGANALIEENALVSEEGLLEANRKTVNDIFLSTAAQGIFSLDESQLEAVQSIAEQCPFEGGQAVYLARALYQWHEYRTFDDLALCEEPELRPAPLGIEPSTPAETFRFYPNPGAGALNVAVPEAYLGQRLQLKLSSLTGRLLTSKGIASANIIERLETDQIPGGIYSVEVWAAGQHLATERLVIIK